MMNMVKEVNKLLDKEYKYSKYERKHLDNLLILNKVAEALCPHFNNIRVSFVTDKFDDFALEYYDEEKDTGFFIIVNGTQDTLYIVPTPMRECDTKLEKELQEYILPAFKKNKMKVEWI